MGRVIPHGWPSLIEPIFSSITLVPLILTASMILQANLSHSSLFCSRGLSNEEMKIHRKLTEIATPIVVKKGDWVGGWG